MTLTLKIGLLFLIWSAIFDLTVPQEQLQHFNQITLWLLDLHAPHGSQLILKEL
jgi:hypothetical protein